ncbi:DNA mismatch repair protein MutL [Halobacteriales archaeon QH_2_66_30]|nr:MAG: DNA mismatch repair protein MutL [Halobacteriales archaeon QH_2_66_30]
MTQGTQPEIEQLDSRTVERIAAGEVVERPASVVKELVENSLDADAGRVAVAVEAGGTEGIRVTDDGVGMSEDALRRAVEKHTTSKIGDIEDLESGVRTLGFRGEALHAVGAVSRLTITSRPRGGDRGTELTVEGGEIADVSPAGAPEGTSVEVRDLFYNVPARRKYLKQEATEFAHVNRVVTSYALANPDVAVTLEHDGRETFSTTGSGDLRETVLSVYGREVAENMVDLRGADLPEGPLDGVAGLVSDPETTRATREYLSTFVNGRYVTSGAVREAVVDAYGKQLAADRYPFAVIFLDVDPGTVDVNVHPRKLEVRWSKEDGVRDQVRTAVEETLLAEGLIRSSAPRGRSAPEQARIDPGDDGDDGDQPGEASSTDTAVSEDRSPPAGKRSDGEGRQAGPSPTVSNETIDSDAFPDAPESAPSSPGGRSPESVSSSGPQGSDPAGGNTGTEPQSTGDRGESAADRTAAHGHSPVDDGPGATDRPSPGDGSRKFRESGTQDRLGDGEPAETFERLPSMRVLGQYDETYVVAETADGLVLIDQHAADERINYERLRESFAGETTTQALAEPVSLELTAREAELFASHREALARLGFNASLGDDRTLTVTTVPSLVAEAADPSLLRDVLAEFVSGEAAAAETVEAAADSLLADLACYPSITGNTSLTEGSVVELLSRLDGCENPYACPHGRPVLIEFDSEEIENRFERDYPGHE